MEYPGVGLYENVASIAATDGTHVEFTLTEANPEFPSDVADYHAAILSQEVTDPATEWIGTGPFTIQVVLGGGQGHPQEEPEVLDER